MTPSADLLPRQRLSVGQRWRASFRDTMRLLREFRATLVLFVLTTLGAGSLYGMMQAAYDIAPDDHIPTIDLPYHMAQLMTLQAEPPPAGMPAPMVMFWYVMPFAGLFVLGQIVQFIQLFFDRSGRAAAWQEAIASTMKDHTIVIGLGHVGLGVARALIDLKTQVVAVNQGFTPETASTLSAMNVVMIDGDGRSAETLARAYLHTAQALVVCTSSDAINFEIIMRARDLNPQVRIVARTWDSQYAKQLREFLGVERIVSSAEVSAPVFAGAAVGADITQTIHVRGRSYVVVRLTVAAGSAFEGRTVGSVQDRYDVDIVLLVSGDDDTEPDVHPPNDQVLCAGDSVTIFVAFERLAELLSKNRANGRH
jgi:Trk K+ transport system NAD-binding subunit